MGSIRIRFAAVAAFLLLATGVARAQDGVVWSTVADSLAAEGVAVPDSLYKGFNALQYSMQRRYRPDDEILYHKADSAYVFGDGRKGYAFVGFGSLADFLNDSGADSNSWIRGAYLDLGHRFHQYNSLRLGLSAGQFYRNSDYRSFYRAGLSFEHNFYIVSYLEGFKRIRPFDVYTVAGLGADVFLGSDKTGETFNNVGSITVAPYLKLGFGFQFKFGERTSLVFTPQYQLYPVQIVAVNNGVGNIDARQYNSGFSIRGGLQFDLGDCFDGARTKEMQSEDYSALDLPVFISLQAGVQFQNGNAARTTQSLLSALRESASLSVGKWMTPVLAARGSLYHGRDIWKRFTVETGSDPGKLCQYDALRLELMLDPFGAGKSSRRDVGFSLPLILGLETGMMQKEDYSVDIKRAYVGLSTGLQLRYNFSRLAAYLEPHCSFVPYTFNDVAFGQLLSNSKNYWDAVISLSLGLEISLGR